MIAARVGATTTIDGAPAAGCVVEPAGNVEGADYETLRCQVQQGAHNRSGDKPCWSGAYGYGSAGS